MFCHQCGSTLVTGAKFCAKCGISLIESTSNQTAGFNPQAQAPSPTMGDATQALNSTQQSELADRSTRLGACVLDFLIFLACLIPGLMVISASDSDGGKGFGGALLAMGWLGLLVIQTVYLMKYGQSLGKRVLKIRIVRMSDDSVPGFVKVVLLRLWVPGLVCGIPYAGQIFWLLDGLFIFRDDKRCLHDLIAETKVIKV